jgi:ribonuclease III|tara:strand:- start:1725 stop:2393 length:669 start_codon:yes stop_codon:yes gene_type:complete
MLFDHKKLEKIIDIKFKKPEILLKSITHKSYDPVNSNEKLEFLGDRILGFIISKRLLEIYPNESEGVLDKKLASLVNKNKCFEVAKSINLDKFILVKKSEKKNVKIVDKIVADCCESIIGAIYLDKGFNEVEKFILKLWQPHLEKSIITFIDSKSKLQEYSLKRFKVLPIYKLVENSGPRHQPTFKIGVKLRNSKFVYATGSSKKDTEQKAATLFLKNIGNK